MSTSAYREPDENNFTKEIREIILASSYDINQFQHMDLVEECLYDLCEAICKETDQFKYKISTNHKSTEFGTKRIVKLKVRSKFWKFIPCWKSVLIFVQEIKKGDLDAIKFKYVSPINNKLNCFDDYIRSSPVRKELEDLLIRTMKFKGSELNCYITKLLNQKKS